MLNRFKTFRNDDSGATAIEYGLIAAGIAVVIIAAVNLLGSNVSDSLQGIATAVGDNNTKAGVGGGDGDGT